MVTKSQQEVQIAADQNMSRKAKAMSLLISSPGWEILKEELSHEYNKCFEVVLDHTRDDKDQTMARARMYVYENLFKRIGDHISRGEVAQNRLQKNLRFARKAS